MTTTAPERLAVIYDSYRLSYQNRAVDLKAAGTATQVQQILANVSSLEASYLDAAKKSLEATGDAVEEACAAAAAARDECTDAYAEAKQLAERIRLVAKSAKAVASLVIKASGKS